MTTIGQAVAALGIESPDEYDLCIVRFDEQGPVNYRLADVARKRVTGEIFIGSGLFRPATLHPRHGRKGANVAAILWLPFDFDLADYLGFPEDKAERKKQMIWLHAMPQVDLDAMIGNLRQDVEETFRLLNLPIHRLDYTGYGLCAYVYLPRHRLDVVTELQGLHKAIVTRINKVWRGTLADPGVSDAGSRITRLVPAANRKGPIERQTATLYYKPELLFATEAQLREAAGEATAPPQRLVPRSGHGLPDGTVEQLIDAILPSWREGSRHALALALAGMLAKHGIPEAQAELILERLAADDEERGDRLTAVRTSYERVRSGMAAKGFFGLRELLPAAALEWLDATLSAHAKRGVRLSVGGKRYESAAEPQTEEDEYQPAPEAALRGWIGEYCRLMQPTTEAPAGFHLGVGLTVAGAVIGRRISIVAGGDVLYPNLFSLLVGRSGKSRKDTAIKRGVRMLSGAPMGARIIKHEISITTDVASSEGLLKVLSDKPNTLLYITEFSKLVGNARRKATTTIVPTLIEAFDTPPVMANLNKASPVEARYPYLSILSATQPDILASLMADEDIHSGFANRWMFFCGSGVGPLPTPPAVDPVAAAKLLGDLWDIRQNVYPDEVALRFDAATQQRWNDWYCADYSRASGGPEEDAMRVRHSVLIQKIALIYAVADAASAIQLAHLEAAIAVIDWMWRHVQRLMATWGGNLQREIEQRIIEVLTKQGPMKRWQLQAKCSNRRWSAKDFSGALRALMETESVIADGAGYVAINPEAAA